MPDADCPSVQWAAVRTCWGEIRVPPQKGVLPKALTSPTCQKYSDDDEDDDEEDGNDDDDDANLPGVLVGLALLAADNPAVSNAPLNTTLAGSWGQSRTGSRRSGGGDSWTR